VFLLLWSLCHFGCLLGTGESSMIGCMVVFHGVTLIIGCTRRIRQDDEKLKLDKEDFLHFFPLTIAIAPDKVLTIFLSGFWKCSSV